MNASAQAAGTFLESMFNARRAVQRSLPAVRKKTLESHTLLYRVSRTRNRRLVPGPGAKAVNSRKLVVRRMTESELNLALEWAAAEGWNPGLYDAACFYAVDPNGFFLGEFVGEPIGCISAVAYDEHYGFVGFYIVKPQYRGRGFGLQLWDAAMVYLGRHNVGLDGVIIQQGNYKKSGFKLAYRNIRHQGEGGGAEPSGLLDLSSVDFDEIVRYDGTVFPASRPSFLRRWIRQPQGAALGI